MTDEDKKEAEGTKRLMGSLSNELKTEKTSTKKGEITIIIRPIICGGATSLKQGCKRHLGMMLSSFWDNQLKICPLYLTGNGRGLPLWANQCDSDNAATR